MRVPRHLEARLGWRSARGPQRSDRNRQDQAATDALQHVLRDGWSARLDYAVDIGCTLRQAVATGSHWHECPEVQRDLLRPSVLAIEGQPIEFPGETRNAPALDELIRCRRDRGHTTLLVVDDNDDGRTDDYLRSVLAMQPDCWIEFTERVAGKGVFRGA